tara:strand:- start:1307 stop:1468 length:162 start_codon:yes stop_codon:yes gene_type:complete
MVVVQQLGPKAFVEEVEVHDRGVFLLAGQESQTMQMDCCIALLVVLSLQAEPA